MCVVDTSSVVEEFTDGSLDAFDAGRWEGWGVIVWISELHFSTVLRLVVSMWGVLWSFRWRMVELGESFGDISWHGEVAGALDVIPFEGDATVERGIPINRDSFVVSFEYAEKMVGVFFSFVFDREVVNNKAELDWSIRMLP